MDGLLAFNKSLKSEVEVERLLDRNMEKSLLSNLIGLKLEMLGVIVDALPEPIKAQAIRNHRELIKVIHQATGEYLAQEKTGKDEQNTVQKVNIQ